MSEPDPNKNSSQQQKEPRPKSGLSPGAKLALAAAFIAAVSSPLVNQHNWNKFKGEIGSRLTAVEDTVSKYERSASIKRLGEWINKKLEVVEQILEKMKKGKVSSSEMREMLAAIKDILNNIKSILNFFCSFGSKENKDNFQIMFDKTSEEIERLISKPSVELEEEEQQQRFREAVDNTRELLKALLKFCVFVEQGKQSQQLKWQIYDSRA